MVRKHSVALLAAVFGFCCARVALGSDLPQGVYVESVNATGDGCAPGTTSVYVSPDASAFTVMFAEYTVAAGGATGPASQRKSCAIDLALRVPAGWTFALDQVDFRGYAALEPNARGEQASSVSYPPRMALTRLASLALRGPLDDGYQNHVDVPSHLRVTAPCVGETRRLLLRTNIGVATQYRANALMTVDSVDGFVEHRYGFAWKRCGLAR